MFERDADGLERMIERLREPVEMDPLLDTHVMARVFAAPMEESRLAAAWDWLRRPRDFSLTPLSALAAAAVLAGLALWLGGRVASRASTASRPNSAVVEFVFIAQGATSVALVGDFNDWDATSTPMRPARQGGLWSVALPLPPGRHRYAFLINGWLWLSDPTAPRAQDDFGTPSSVVTVGG
ncbi:MAG: isoamylase early set domain-containing protein [Gemmatimonadales bacterium]